MIRKCLLSLLALFVVGCRTASAPVSRPVQKVSASYTQSEIFLPKGVFGLTGTWGVGSNSGSGHGWQESGKELQFLIAPTMKRRGYGQEDYPKEGYPITRTESLPKGSWAIDMCVQWLGWYDDLQVCIDDDHGNRIVAAEIIGNMAPGLSLLWVRVANDPAKQKSSLFVNGKKYKDGPLLPNGRVVLVMQGRHLEGNTGGTTTVLSFIVTPGANLEFCAPGLAFAGWSLPVRAEVLKEIPDLDARMDAVFQASKTDVGKSYALAAKILAEYGRSGTVGDSTWRQLSSFVEQLMPRDRAGLSLVLPIATACANGAQRAQAQDWTAKFFDVRSSDWQRLGSTSATPGNANLLDPIRAGQMGSPIGYHEACSAAKALKKIAPQYALFPLLSYIDHNDWKMSAMAWMLPDICAASPEYGKTAIDTIADFKQHYKPAPTEPDKTISFAAYRLAETNPKASSKFVQMIADPQVKAETINAIAKKMSESGSVGSTQAKQMEQLLRQEIDQWKPSPMHDAPVQEMIDLARFYASQGRRSEASKLLDEAALKLASSQDDICANTVNIALCKRQIHASDYRIWWNKAVSLSVEQRTFDRNGGISISGLYLMARDLVRDGKLDEALGLVHKMDPYLQQNNIAMALDLIIKTMLKNDTNRAVSLLKEYPDMEAKYRITGMVAAHIARRDVQRALELIKDLPGKSKTDALLRIAQVVPTKGLRRVVGDLKASLSTSMQSGSGSSLGWGVNPDSIKKYTSLPIDTFLSLSDGFGNAPDYYAMCLLSCVAKNCGLEDDPLWVQFSGSDRADGLIPWTSDRLKYAAISDQAAGKRKNTAYD